MYPSKDAASAGLLHQLDTGASLEWASEVLLVYRLATDYYKVTSWDPDLFRRLWVEESWVQDLLLGQA